MAKEEVVIQAEKRTVTGKQVKALRRQGLLPGVIYGRHLEAFPIQMNAHEASLTLGKLTTSSLVTIDVDGQKHTVLVRDRQRDVIYGNLVHVDFYAISLTEKLRTTVEIRLVGEAPVTKSIDAVIIQAMNAIELECLPEDLPEIIDIDISKLETVDDEITVADLNLGDQVTLLADPSEVIVSVGYAAQEEMPAEEAAEAIEPEVVEKGKKEEEEEEAA